MSVMFICYISLRDVNSQKLINVINQVSALSGFFSIIPIEHISKNIPSFLKVVPTIIDKEQTNIYTGTQCFELVTNLQRKITQKVATESSSTSDINASSSSQEIQLQPYTMPSTNEPFGNYSSINEAFSQRIETPQETNSKPQR